MRNLTSLLTFAAVVATTSSVLSQRINDNLVVLYDFTDGQGNVVNDRAPDLGVPGEPINLTYTEFMILHFLARQPGFVRSRNQIVNAVHGEETAVTDRSVDVQIVSLRKKMGSYGKYIQTVRNVGYKFKD